MKKIFCFIVLMSGWLMFGTIPKAEAQGIALKTNLSYWALAGSPNAAVEFGLSKKVSLDVGGGFNLWNLPQRKRVKHWIVQPEVRYWFCDVFNGHFMGLHLHGGQLNVGGFDIPVGRLTAFKDNRYEGYFYGAGLSYGYQWVIAPQWNIELSLGGGWARTHYRQFDCAECGAFKHEGTYDYFGVTRATVSLVFFIK